MKALPIVGGRWPGRPLGRSAGLIVNLIVLVARCRSGAMTTAAPSGVAAPDGKAGVAGATLTRTLAPGALPLPTFRLTPRATCRTLPARLTASSLATGRCAEHADIVRHTTELASASEAKRPGVRLLCRIQGAICQVPSVGLSRRRWRCWSTRSSGSCRRSLPRSAASFDRMMSSRDATCTGTPSTVTEAAPASHLE
jgi:hypothetical protein